MGGKPFVCRKCFYHTKYKLSFQLHLKTHNSASKTKKCNFCLYHTDSKLLHRLHRKIKHGVGQMLTCRACYFRTTSDESFSDHIEASHGVEKRILEDCQDSTNLKEIDVIRANEKYGCPSCSFYSKTRKAMNKHVKEEHPKKKKRENK